MANPVEIEHCLLICVNDFCILLLYLLIQVHADKQFFKEIPSLTRKEKNPVFNTFSCQYILIP